MNNRISDYLKEIGKRGGEKTKQRGTEHYKAIGRAGALKRWGKVSDKAPDPDTTPVSKTGNEIYSDASGDRRLASE